MGIGTGTRRFGKRIYHLANSYVTKQEAEQKAKGFRLRGWFARIEKSGKWDAIWFVWVSK